MWTSFLSCMCVNKSHLNKECTVKCSQVSYFVTFYNSSHTSTKYFSRAEILYLGQRSPVHASTANVNVLPVHHPKGGKQSSSGEGCHVDVVNFCIWERPSHVGNGWGTVKCSTLTRDLSVIQLWHKQYCTFVMLWPCVYPWGTGAAKSPKTYTSLWQTDACVCDLTLFASRELL